MRRLVLLALLLALLPGCTEWSPWQTWLGNRAYGDRDYAKAAEHYRQAAAEDPAAQVNLGDALYQQGKYAEAATELTKATEDPSPAIRARANYDLGNARFQQEDWAGAAEAYKAALRYDEDDDDARHNLQVALDKLKSPPPEPNPSPSPPPQQDPQPSPSPSPSPSPQSGGQPSPSPTAAQPQPSGSPAQPQPAKPQGLSKEDAERLLRYFRDRERENRPMPRAERHLQPPRGTETW